MTTTFNPTLIHAHVDLLHRCANGIDGVLVVSVFHASADSKADRAGTVTHHPVGDVDGMVAAIMAQESRPGANVYVGLHVMRPDLAAGRRGTAKDIVALLGLVADMDSDTGKADGELPVEPSYILETSPGNGQPVWLFEHPLTPEEAQPLATSLRTLTQSDAGTADICHVWRVPGTLNWPNAKKISRGRAIEPTPVLLAQAWDGEFVEVDAFRAAMPVSKPAKERPQLSIDGLPSTAMIDVDQDIAAMLDASGEPDRSTHAARTIEALAFRGYTPDEALALILACSGAWKERYKTANALRKDVERLWVKFGSKHEGEQAALIALGKFYSSKLISNVVGGVAPIAIVPASIQPESATNEPGVPPMHADPFDPASAGGILEDLANWITRTSIIPVPELSLVSSIALLAGLFGDKALGPTSTGVNLYLTTILATAGGKGHPPKAIRRVSDLLGAAGVVSNGDHTSYAALERTLRKHSSTTVVMDEFGITLQDVNGKQRSAASASIRKFLLAIYDQANSSFDGRTYASADMKSSGDTPIIGPALTVLGMTTFETLYEGLNEASISDGFLNRFIFVTAKERKEPIRPPKLHRDSAVPPDITETMKEAIDRFPRVKEEKDRKWIVTFAGGEDGPAYARWGEIFLWQHDGRWGSEQRDIRARAAENTLRLATLRAISRDPTIPMVNLSDVEWGWAIVFRSIILVQEGIHLHMAASPAEALRKAVMEALRAAKDETMMYSKLLERKGVRGSDTRQLEEALRWLVDGEQIIDLNARPKPGKGSKLKVKRAVVLNS